MRAIFKELATRPEKGPIDPRFKALAYDQLLEKGLPYGYVNSAVKLLLEFYDAHQPKVTWAIRGRSYGAKWWWIEDELFHWTTTRECRAEWPDRARALQFLHTGREEGLICGGTLVKVTRR